MKVRLRKLARASARFAIVGLVSSVGCLTSAPGIASAQDGAGSPRGDGGIRDLSPQERPQNLSVMMFVPWWYGIGIGAMARYEIPVVPDGFIPQINDHFSIEPSLAFSYTRDYGYYYRALGSEGLRRKALNIAPAVYATWSFHITQKFRPYAAIGLGYSIGVDVGDVHWSPSYFYFDSAVGLFYDFSSAVAFRGEIGAQGPKAGLSVYF